MGCFNLTIQFGKDYSTLFASQLEAETTARQEADALFASQLEAETTARQEADALFASQLEAETTARQEADALFASQINEIENNYTSTAYFMEHLDDKEVHINNLGANPNLDNVTVAGYYSYILGSSHFQQKYLLMVTTNGTSDITQFKWLTDGLYIRHFSVGWSDWTLYGADTATTVAEIQIGSLPNAESKVVAHGIIDFSRRKIKSVTGFARRRVDGMVIPIPYFSENDEFLSIKITVDDTCVTVQTFADRSDFEEAFVYIEYFNTLLPPLARVYYDAGEGVNPPIDNKLYRDGETITLAAPGEMSHGSEHFVGWLWGSKTLQPGKTVVFSGVNDIWIPAVWGEGPTPEPTLEPTPEPEGPTEEPPEEGTTPGPED